VRRRDDAIPPWQFLGQFQGADDVERLFL